MNMQCFCGATTCRGRITGADWQIEELQKKYGDHYLPYILNKIKNSKN